MTKPLSFPTQFTWGVATSSFQIEGAHDKDGRSFSIWDTFCRTPNKVFEGHNGDVACDHYYLWETDLDLIKDLGVSAYRFSVAWPRVIPEGRGEVNTKGLDFYDKLVDGILERGLEPYCTLYHWDLPQILEDKGGWLNRDTAYAFADYADAVSKKLGDRVISYATLNEPWCSAFLGYFDGHHAPGHNDRNLNKYLTAVHHLLLAHGLAMPILRENAPKAQHGIVLNLAQVYPEDPDSDLDQTAAKNFDTFNNQLYTEPLFKAEYPKALRDNLADYLPEIQKGDLEIISAPIDFLGENYYTPTFVKHKESSTWPHMDWVDHPKAEKTAMGWEVYAQGLSDMLERLDKDYKVPLFVTENGAAYDDQIQNGEIKDKDRVSYYQRHLEATLNAINKGANVQGYFAWSLMDNFEWAFGYDKRFGIVHVDFESQKRTLKDSAKWYQQLVKANTRAK